LLVDAVLLLGTDVGMDTRESEDKTQSLEETLQLLDAYPTRLSLSEETLCPVDADPDPAAIDATMQMLVESGWTFESDGPMSASFDADAVSVLTSASSVTDSVPLASTTISASTIATTTGSVAVTQPRISVLDDIDLLLTHQRGRKREQLIQLRAAVQALEGRVLQLRQANLMRSAANQITPASAQANAATNDARVWQQIAERQYEARRKVELENARLRASLQAQIEVARRLERLLKKQRPSSLP
jgi:hypothetical protein